MEYQKFISELETELDQLEIRTDDILFKAEAGISLSNKYIKQLRKKVISKGFESVDAEIKFFKYTKPQILSKLIYYAKLFSIESKRPRSSSKFQLKYLNQNINKLQQFFHDNLNFYNYYRRGASTLDELYFVRGETDIRAFTDYINIQTDVQFSTPQDITVAIIIAYDMLIVYLQQEIAKLENQYDSSKPKNMKQSSNLFWTGSKTELIELIYALHSSGAINSGTADIKEIATFFESTFNIELGNYYHTFIEIRARKCSKTKFLDRLTQALIKRCNELDE